MTARTVLCWSDGVRRSGSTLVEALTATAVLAVVFLSLVPMLASFRDGSRRLEASALAVEEVRNVLERVMAEHQAGRFELESLDQMKTRPELEPFLGETRWTWDAKDIAEPTGRKLTVRLEYGVGGKFANSAGQAAQLSTWLWEVEK